MLNKLLIFLILINIAAIFALIYLVTQDVDYGIYLLLCFVTMMGLAAALVSTTDKPVISLSQNEKEKVIKEYIKNRKRHDFLSITLVVLGISAYFIAPYPSIYGVPGIAAMVIGFYLLIRSSCPFCNHHVIRGNNICPWCESKLELE